MSDDAGETVEHGFGVFVSMAVGTVGMRVSRGVKRVMLGLGKMAVGMFGARFVQMLMAVDMVVHGCSPLVYHCT